MAGVGLKTPKKWFYILNLNIWWLEVVNANITQEERKNDTNHQYTTVDPVDGYCVKCGHYDAVPYTCTECECDCHDG